MSRLDTMLEAAKEYSEGRKIRKQIGYLSNAMLGQKFERSPKVIRKIHCGEPVRGVPDDERRLILDCLAERTRLQWVYRGKTLEALKEKYGLCRESIVDFAECVDG